MKYVVRVDVSGIMFDRVFLILEPQKARNVGL